MIRTLSVLIPLCVAACSHDHVRDQQATSRLSRPPLVDVIDSCSVAQVRAERDVVRIDHFVLNAVCATDGKEADPELAGLLARLRSTGRVFYLRSDVATRMGAPPPRFGALEDMYVVRDDPQARSRLSREQYARPCLNPGGSIGALAFHGLPGHSDVTGAAIRSLQANQEPGFSELSSSAIAIIQDAAQDPDFYEWGHPEAHGQTPNNDKTGLALQDSADPERWQLGFRRWTRRQIDRSLAAARQGDYRQSLYFLGYALHAVQDVAAHQGRTNAEHSFNAGYENDDPDAKADAVRDARFLTIDALKMIRREFAIGDHDTWGVLTAFRGEPIDAGTKAAWHGHGWDFGIGPLLAYMEQGKVFGKLDTSVQRAQRIRWCEYAKCGAIITPIFSAPTASR